MYMTLKDIIDYLALLYYRDVMLHQIMKRPLDLLNSLNFNGQTTDQWPMGRFSCLC